MPKKSGTEAALLAAILASPDDDLPRLVFADWCEENGDPDRAEFIRTEIEMAKMMPDPDTAARDSEHPRYQPLEDRRGELWDVHGDRWYPELGKSITEFNSFRGFPYRITTSAAKFLKHACELLLAVPTLHEVVIEKLGRNAVALAGCKAFAQVEKLSFASPSTFHPSDAIAFFQSRQLHKLRTLDLGENSRIETSGAEALANCPSLVNLERLSLQCNTIEDDGATAILRQKRFHALRHLNLDGNDLSDLTPFALADATNSNPLTSLSLAWNGVTDRGVAWFHTERLTALEELDLTGNRIGPASATHLTASAFTPTLKTLDLSRCGLGKAGTAILLSGRFSRLEALNLFGNPLDESAVRELNRNGELRSLRTLAISKCGVGALAASLANVATLPDLRSLELGDEPFPPHAMREFAAGRLLRTVETLHVDNAGLTDAGAKALAAADLPNLRSLNLSRNRITDAGARALLRSKTLGGLRGLWLARNGLTPKMKAMVKERFGEDGCSV